MPSRRVHPLLHSFNELFVVCKFLGIYPHELRAFMWEKSLKKSNLGIVIVLTVMSIVVVLYNLLIYYFSGEETKASQSTLTFAIGLFLTYIAVVMMITDQLTAICNQNKIGNVFESIRKVDERLYKEQIVTYNSSIVRLIRILITLTIACELTVTLAVFVTLVDYTQWISLLWLFSSMPTLYSSLDKIWFAAILNALKKRFESINQAMEELVQSHEKHKTKQSLNLHVKTTATPTVTVLPPPIALSSNYTDYIKFPYKKINAFEKKSKGKSFGRGKVKPISMSSNDFGGDINKPQQFKPLTDIKFDSELNNIIKIEEKLNNFCTIHDEICEIGKSLNELWSYPILVSMAHGFLIFTAELYFVYCATQKQDIPSLFRVAKSAWITAVCLAYTSGKCIYLIYISWSISLESKRTGICLHKCGIAADNNQFYEIVNHLSLKLLNHSVDFSACGFFTLDMETLYSVCGGITSYLVILIQFNLATQQAKDATYSAFYSNQTSSLATSHENSTIFLSYLMDTILATTTSDTTDNHN